MKTFLSLKAEEYLDIAPKIFTNAGVLLETAKDSANKSNYGVACSLNILGMEELIKSLVVYLRGNGAKVFEIKDLSKIFSKHQTKHQTILLLKGLYIVFEISRSLKAEPSSKFKPRSKKVEEIGSKIIKIIRFMKPIAKYTKDIEWWDKANALKNNGLYVNYINTELLPQKITKDEYHACENMSTKVKEKINLIIEFLDDEKYKSEIVSLINDGVDLYNESH